MVLEVVSGVVNFLIDAIVSIINVIALIFPNDPIRDAIDTIKYSIGSELLGYINYFLPISEMVSILMVWITAIALYYVYSIILRWGKAIS